MKVKQLVIAMTLTGLTFSSVAAEPISIEEKRYARLYGQRDSGIDNNVAHDAIRRIVCRPSGIFSQTSLTYPITGL